MKNTYEIIVAIKPPGLKTKTYTRKVNLNYNDETFQECEGILRDTLKDIANEAIDELWYS
jgi:hypothetical protein